MVRTKDRGLGKLRYARRPEEETAEDKLSWIQSATIDTIEFTHIAPNQAGGWIDQSTDPDWPGFLAVADPNTKSARDTKRRWCPRTWCSLGVAACFPASDWAGHVPGTAESMMMGLSLTGARVSSVM